MTRKKTAGKKENPVHVGTPCAEKARIGAQGGKRKNGPPRDVGRIKVFNRCCENLRLLRSIRVCVRARVRECMRVYDCGAGVACKSTDFSQRLHEFFSTFLLLSRHNFHGHVLAPFSTFNEQNVRLSVRNFCTEKSE
jgi:hypothetical protein